MPKNGTKIYKKARLDAGLTQEQAAELLESSVESVKAYETGLRIPPAARVADMARLYGAPWLCAAHARETDELGVIPGGTAARTLPQVTVQLVGYMLDWSERRRARQLLAISADNMIDAEERSIFDEIVCELEAIAAAWLELKAMSPPGIKNEHPEAATSKRSTSKPCGVTGRSLLTQPVYQTSAEMSRETESRRIGTAARQNPRENAGRAGKAVSLT